MKTNVFEANYIYVTTHKSTSGSMDAHIRNDSTDFSNFMQPIGTSNMIQYGVSLVNANLKNGPPNKSWKSIGI